MGENERRLILNVQITAQLKRAMAFRAVHEDGDGEKDSPNRELATGEDGPGRNRKLMLTTLALEQGAGLVAVNAQAAATRADRIAVCGGPSNLFEGFRGFLRRHASNPS